MNLMNVTVIDGDLSYPANSGKRLRTISLLLPLAREFAITYIARAEGSSNREAETHLRDHGITPILVPAPLPDKTPGLGFYGRLARNLLSPLPYSVTSHRLEPMVRAVAAHAAKSQVDLWQLEWLGYEYCIPRASTAPVVLQAHNVDTLLWQRYARAETNPLRRQFIASQARKFHAFEQRLFGSLSRVMAVSEADARIARELFGAGAIDVVENGVDIEGFARIEPDLASRKVLFLGALDWRPNQDAIATLLDQIWPLVRARMADARLVIVGRNPPKGLAERIAAMEGVELHANVADVRPYLAACAVMAVPLRIGGGSRLKILEACAAGLPVVSSTVGAEGLAIEPGTSIRIADGYEPMADALTHALGNPGAQREMARSARAWVAQHHDWGLLSAKVGEVWRAAMADGRLREPVDAEGGGDTSRASAGHA